MPVYRLAHGGSTYQCRRNCTQIMKLGFARHGVQELCVQRHVQGVPCTVGKRTGRAAECAARYAGRGTLRFDTMLN